MKFLNLYEIADLESAEIKSPTYTYGRYVPENNLDKQMLVQCAIATAKSITWAFDKDDCSGHASLTNLVFDNNGFGSIRLCCQKKPFNPLCPLDDSFSFWATIWIDRDHLDQPLAMWQIDNFDGHAHGGSQSNSLSYPPVIN
jgi:hypothetical protein